jgi:APA family basic amino acid/polyamine antiporter
MAETSEAQASPKAGAIGFWQCWAFSVGTMIGSGIFMMPAVLAPYGGLSIAGWVLTAGGSIAIALAISRLAGRTTRSGGIPVYVEDAVGGLPAFLVTWLYWTGCWTSNTGLAIAFVGYFIVLVPAVGGDALYQISLALAVMWTFTLVAMRGTRDAGFVQLLFTVLKLTPLALVIGVGFFRGEAATFPAVNPSGLDPLKVISITALATMYAFLGLEIGATPAAEMRDARRTGPRAIVVATLTAAIIYIASTAAVMLLVPTEILAQSTSPFADAVRGLGTLAPILIAVGALVSVAGALNGSIFLTGQVPMAAANGGQAPRVFGRLNSRAAPWVSLAFSGALASVLLLMNYSRGLVGAYTFVLTMATLTTLVPYLVCGLIELRRSWRSARGWALVGLIAAVYCLFAIFGAGLEVLLWCGVLAVLGVPIYYLGRQGRPVVVEPV